MSDVVFILGAGASFDAGAPLMAGFLDKARDLLAAKKIDPASAVHFQRVFGAISALQQVHSKSQLDLYNIESVFATFEMGKLINKLPGATDAAERDKLVVSMKRLIQVTLEQSITYGEYRNDIYRDGRLSPNGSYGEFANLICEALKNPAPTYSIIDFNYDLALDTALWSRAVEIDYCLSAERKPGYLPLLKLHGSLNWAQCQTCDMIVAWELKSYASNFTFEYDVLEKEYRVRLGAYLQDSHLEHCGLPVRSEPFIVPPTWNKTQYHGGLANVWSRAAQELGEAETIIVIGYSLPETDAFFRYLFALGTVGNNLIRRFYVCDPSDATCFRFRELLGLGAKDRVTHIKDEFKKAVGELRSELTGSGRGTKIWFMT